MPSNETALPIDRRLSLFVVLLFFLSGCFALVYQVSWVRAVTLEFGSTTLAVSTVVTIFLGGLALGAWLVGGRADRWRRPLAAYGLLELALAAYTLLTPRLFEVLLPMFSRLVYGFSDSVLVLSLVRFVGAGALLLPPTILMGATLPVLVRFWTLRAVDSGKWAGLLYGINTTGAFVGTVLGGFWLLPTFGLQSTVYAVGACNVLLAAAALLAARRTETGPARSGPSPAPPAPLAPAGSTAAPASAARAATGAAADWPVYTAVALTGLAALVCEVAWTRVLVLVLGPSVYAFTIVLATFLAGLGLGSAAVAALLRAQPRSARIVFYLLALAAAAAVTATSAAFAHLPPLFVALYEAWQVKADVDNVLLIQVLLSATVILAPSLIMGGLFPAAVRVLSHDRTSASRQVGRLYAWNTAGAITGSFFAGFLLIPELGIRGTLLIAVAAQLLGATAIVLDAFGTRRTLLFIGGSFAALVLLVRLTPPWHHQLMASGAYYYAASYEGTDAPSLSRELQSEARLLFYEDGLTATVTVTQDLRSRDRDLYISTNGKLDGSSHYDMPTQRLSAHLPLLVHPSPREVAVIGMGTGTTAGSAGLYPVERVTVVEIEAAMVEGARWFREHNNAVHENPRVDIRISDGRLFLNHRPDSFDVIISEPSNPWLAGASDLFTQEFFRLGARALRQDGVFAQWLQLYGMAPENVQIVVRTFASVFPYVYLASTIPDSDVLLLGAMHPLDLDPKRIEAAILAPGIREDLADPRVGIANVYDLLARVRMGPDGVRALAGEGVLHTDDLPVIAYRAPRDLYKDTRRDNMRLLARLSRGIAPLLDLYRSDRKQAAAVLERLAAAYEAFLPGGNEAQVTRTLAEQAESQSLPLNAEENSLEP